MGLDSIFFDIPHIQTECGEYQKKNCGILSVPYNVVMNMNNVMKGTRAVYVSSDDIKVFEIC